MEIWRDIRGYEGLYQVSNYGRVRSLYYGRMKIRKLSPNWKGYLLVSLKINGKEKCYQVHRLVAEAFIPNPYNLPQVNHKDECKTNNIVENLEWCDNKYNANYGTRGERIGEKLKGNKNPMMKAYKAKEKKVDQIDKVTGEVLHQWYSLSEAARKLNVGKTNICLCCIGRQKTAFNFVWKYPFTFV